MAHNLFDGDDLISELEKRLEEEQENYREIKRKHDNSMIGKKKRAFSNGYKQALRDVILDLKWANK